MQPTTSFTSRYGGYPIDRNAHSFPPNGSAVLLRAQLNQVRASVLRDRGTTPCSTDACTPLKREPAAATTC